MKFISAIALSVTLMTASAASAGNLIQNGDFSAGFTGFTTQYNIVAPAPNALYPEGDITITANPFSVHNLWVDLGETTNPMLIVNGATTGSPTIWEEDNVVTAAGGLYNFSANVMDICCNSAFGDNSNSPSDITFQVKVGAGGWQDVAGYLTTPSMPAQSGDSGISELINGSFTSTAGGSFDIRALNGITAAGGNDFALDNINVSAAVPEPATWAVMMLGFGGLGVAMRARRRQAAATA